MTLIRKSLPLFLALIGLTNLLGSFAFTADKALNLSPYPAGYLTKPTSNPNDSSVESSNKAERPNPLLNDTKKIAKTPRRKRSQVGVQGAAGTQGSNAAVKAPVGTFR